MNYFNANAFVGFTSVEEKKWNLIHCLLSFQLHWLSFETASRTCKHDHTNNKGDVWSFMRQRLRIAFSHPPSAFSVDMRYVRGRCEILTFLLTTLSFFRWLLHVVFPQQLLPEENVKVTMFVSDISLTLLPFEPWINHHCCTGLSGISSYSGGSWHKLVQRINFSTICIVPTLSHVCNISINKCWLEVALFISGAAPSNLERKPRAIRVTRLPQLKVENSFWSLSYILTPEFSSQRQCLLYLSSYSSSKSCLNVCKSLTGIMRVVKHINEADQNLSKNNGCFGSCRRSHSRPSWKTSPKVGVGATTMELHDYGRASFLPFL